MGKLKAAGEIRNDSVISIIDFTKTSDQSGFFVINLHTGRLLFNTWVSTAVIPVYQKQHCFRMSKAVIKAALVLCNRKHLPGQAWLFIEIKGEEAGINDRAEERGIVMHAADYVNESFIKSRGYIGQRRLPRYTAADSPAAYFADKKRQLSFYIQRQYFYLSQSQLLN